MDVTCPDCNSFLRINPNLEETSVPCPRCGSMIQVAKKHEAPKRRVKLELEEPDVRDERDATPATDRRSRGRQEKRPRGQNRRKRKKERPPKDVEPKPVRPRAPMTIWLLGTQLVILAIAACCLVGVYLGVKHNLPRDTFLHENPLALVGFGLSMLFLCLFARQLPVLNSLIAALAVLGACAYNFHDAQNKFHDAQGEIDATRVLMLMLAMVGVWLALQHRRKVALRSEPAQPVDAR
ncbi:MAG: hypothetical protein O7C98_11830 [Planctomycetota bacterium]|nr:hypothetical protein [Planctomycetota bacterium]